jgi:hypothetical protein
MRYKVEKVQFHRVVDTEAAQDPLPVHYEGPDKEFADRLADDLNTNHQNALDAAERIQQDALEEAAQHVIEVAELGRGVDK